MRFFLDHDVPEEAAHLLRYHGHAVTLLRDVLPLTAPDEKVFAHAVEQGMVMVTCNRNDFLEEKKREQVECYERRVVTTETRRARRSGGFPIAFT